MGGRREQTQLKELVRRMSLSPRLIYVQHSYYTDYSLVKDQAGNQIVRQPRYINVYRDPLTQTASHSNYLIAESRPAAARNHENFLRKRRGICGCAETSHLDCVLQAQKDGCAPYAYRLRGETIKYLCGWQEKTCLADTHSHRAYEVARDHLYQMYQFVGLEEHFELSMDALNRLYPEFFCKNVELRHTMNTARNHSDDSQTEYRRLLVSYPGNQFDFRLHMHVVCLFWQRAAEILGPAQAAALGGGPPTKQRVYIGRPGRGLGLGRRRRRALGGAALLFCRCYFSCWYYCDGDQMMMLVIRPNTAVPAASNLLLFLHVRHSHRVTQ
uniref:Protein-tyrosine sulfotransferase n=1 Tax=Heterosigma akashiwo TaxID=2829 RepID=A0A7S4D524_HETAK